jgi:hypothetical protein
VLPLSALLPPLLPHADTKSVVPAAIAAIFIAKLLLVPCRALTLIAFPILWAVAKGNYFCRASVTGTAEGHPALHSCCQEADSRNNCEK